MLYGFETPFTRPAITSGVVKPSHIEILPAYFGFQKRFQLVASAGSILSVRYMTLE